MPQIGFGHDFVFSPDGRPLGIIVKMSSSDGPQKTEFHALSDLASFGRWIEMIRADWPLNPDGSVNEEAVRRVRSRSEAERYSLPRKPG